MDGSQSVLGDGRVPQRTSCDCENRPFESLRTLLFAQGAVVRVGALAGALSAQTDTPLPARRSEVFVQPLENVAP